MNGLAKSFGFLALYLLLAPLNGQADEYRFAFEFQGKMGYRFVNHPYFPAETIFGFGFPEYAAVSAEFYPSPKWFTNVTYGRQNALYNYPDPNRPNAKRLHSGHLSYLTLAANRKFKFGGRFAITTGIGAAHRNRSFSYITGSYPFEFFSVPEWTRNEIGLHLNSSLRYYPLKNQRFWIGINAEFRKFNEIDTWSSGYGIGVQLWKQNKPAKPSLGD